MEIIIHLLHTIYDVTKQFEPILAIISLAFIAWALYKQSQSEKIRAFFYLHQYLAQENFSQARHHIRELAIRKTPYTNWTDMDKQMANRVCTCYDQAGILIVNKVVKNPEADFFLESSWGESICHQYETLKEYLEKPVAPTEKLGKDFFSYFSKIYTIARTYHR